jgi:hypothetical protein
MPDPFRQSGDVGAAGALPKAANPFTPGPGKVPPEFGGRYEVLSLAKAMIERLAVPVDPARLCLLRGARGVGKTALMAYTRRHAAELGVTTLHIEADPRDEDLTATCQSLVRDAAGMVSVAEAFARRLTAISVARGELRFAPPPEERADLRLESLVYDLVVLAERANVGLLLTVDEVHEAEELLLGPLMRAVHRHAQDARPLGVMLAGLPCAARRLIEEGQTYAERLTVVDIGRLDAHGVAVAIREPFQRDAGIDVVPAAIDHVHADTVGYPYFVQLWGEILWDTLPEHRDVVLADVERAQPLVDRARRRFLARRGKGGQPRGSSEVASVLSDIEDGARTIGRAFGLGPGHSAPSAG